MSFSYDEWKKKDKGRAKPKTSSGNFDDWKSKRTTGVDKNEGRIRTYDNHVAKKEIKKIADNKAEDNSLYIPKSIRQGVAVSKFTKDNKAEENSLYIPPSIKSSLNSPAKSLTKSASTQKEKKKEEKATLLSRMLDNAKSQMEWGKPEENKIGSGYGVHGMGSKESDGALRGAFKKGNDNNTLGEKFGANLRAGTGDVLEGLAGVGRWLLPGGGMKMDEKTGKYTQDSPIISKALQGGANKLKVGFDGEVYNGGKEFDFKKAITDPEFYATSVTRAVPQLVTSIIPALGASKLVGMIPKIKNAKTVHQVIFKSLGGAGAATTIDSSIEAGGVYDEAIRRGFTEDDANKAANEAFVKNFALTGGSTFGEFVLGLSPVGRGVKSLGKVGSIAARTAGGAVLEGAQEGGQEWISASALGDKFSWTDPSTIEAMTIGAILGGGVTGGMATLTEGFSKTPKIENPVSDIIQRTANQLPPALREEFDNGVTSLQQSGLELSDAQETMMEKLAMKDPSIESLLDGSTQSYVADQKRKQQTSTDVEVSKDGTVKAAKAESTIAPTASTTDVLSEVLNTAHQTQTAASLTQNPMPQPVAQPNELALNPQLLNNVPQAPQALAQAPLTAALPTVGMDAQQELMQQPMSGSGFAAADTSNLMNGDRVRLRGTSPESFVEVVDSSGDAEVTVRNAEGREYNVERNVIEEIQPTSQTDGQGIVTEDIQLPGSNSVDGIASGNVTAMGELENAGGDAAVAYQNMQDRVDAMEGTLIAKYGEDAFFGADLTAPPGTEENPFTQEETDAFNELIAVRDEIENMESDAGIESIMEKLTDFPVASKEMVEKALREIQYDIQLNEEQKVEQGKIEDVVVQLYDSLSEQLEGTKNALPEPLVKEFEHAVDAALTFEETGIGKNPIEFLLQIDHIMNQGLGVDISEAIPAYEELRGQGSSGPEIVKETAEAEEVAVAELPAPVEENTLVGEEPTAAETEVQDEPLPEIEEIDWSVGDTAYTASGNVGKIAESKDGRVLLKNEGGQTSLPANELLKEPKPKELLLTDVQNGDFVQDNREGYGEEQLEVVDASDENFLSVKTGRKLQGSKGEYDAPPKRVPRKFLKKVEESKPEETKKTTVVESNPTRSGAPTEGMARIHWLVKKMRNSDYTAADLREQFKWLRDNEKQVKEDIYKYLKTSDKHKRKREDTKQKLVESTYREALERPAYGDDSFLSIQHTDIFAPVEEQNESTFKQIEKKINSITDESIAEHLGKRQAEIDKNKKAVDSPETISEYTYKQRTKGLSAEEQAKFDELQALKLKEKQVTKSVAPTEVVSKGEYTITADKHTKTGADLWVVKPKNDLEKIGYAEFVRSMKVLGGYYSRYKKGVIFNEDPTAKLEGDISEEVIAESGRDATRIAERLRTVADSAQKTIDDKRNDNRLTNTAKRASQDAHARNEADAIEKQQGIMRRIADAIESGEAVFLDGVSARTHIEALDRVMWLAFNKRMNTEENSKLSPKEREKVAKQPLTNEEINAIDIPKVRLYPDNVERIVKALTGTKGLGRALARVAKELNAKKGKADNYLNGELIREDMLKVADAALKNEDVRYYAQNIKESYNIVKRLETMNLGTPELLRSGIREYIKYVDDVGENVGQKRKDEKRKREAELTKLNIAGFFPTPTKVIDRMLEDADIQPGMTVLEPSAGKGNIAERIRDEHNDAALDVVEYNFTLNDYLKSQDFNVVADDFLEFDGTYDRIIMNPPFEKGQDIEHVRHAYDLLEPGGKIVAIMSEGPFFRSDKKATAFREWLDELSGESEQLSEGSFVDSDRSTGVATRMVTIDKPMENDRDTFVIERVDQDPFVVKRGDEVLEFIRNGIPMKKVIVKSISQAKKEINGYHYGSFYPLDYVGKKTEKTKPETKKEPAANKGVTFTEKGTEIEFEYQLVEADTLIASNDAAGNINKEYPQELQPRDRTRKSSQAQIQGIAQKLNPELLGESAKASDGAPIVGPDMVVESGNGRTIALKKMYDGKTDKVDAYGSWLAENADRFGLDYDALENMDSPVLVRVRTNEVNRSEFAAEANESNVAAMSATEQAKADATKLTNRVMHLFNPADNGDLNVSSNRAFITAFIGEVTAKNDRGSLLTSDGNLSQEGLIRVRNAVFAKAYDNVDAIGLVSESTDNNVLIVTNAMLQSAPRFAVMKDKIAEGGLHDLNITTEIVEAMTQLAQLRAEGTTVKTHIAQTSMFDEMSDLAKDVLTIYDSKEFKRSTKKLNELFNQYVDVLEAAGDPKQVAMFENITPTKAEILEVAMKRVTNSDQAETQSDLFQDANESVNETRTTTKPKKQATKTKKIKEDSNTDTFVAMKERPAEPSPDVTDEVDTTFDEPTRRTNDADTNNHDRTVTRAQIIKYVKDNFDTTIGVGKTRGREGIYKNKFAIIRTANYADFETLAHELGHRIDTKLGLSVNPAIRNELIKFAEFNLELPEGMSNLKRAREGVAEYFRQVFYNETEANISIDEVSNELSTTIAEGLEKAGWTKSTQVLQDMTASWMNRTAEQELAGIVTEIGSSKRQKRTAKRWMMDIYTSLFEKEHPLWMAEQIIEKELKNKGLSLPDNAKAYVMAVMTRGTTARAVQFTKFATFKTDFNRNNDEFQITGEPLEEILKDVEDPEQFGHYLVAKHAYYLKTKKGKSNTPITEEKIAEYLAYADPKIEALAQRIYDYQNRLLEVLVDGGLIDAELPAKLKKDYPFYVPFYRDMSESGSDANVFGGRSDGFSNQQQGIKKMSEKGSSRNIINPIESIVKNTHLYFALADRNSVGVAMASWADPDSDIATEVARDLIEEVPNSFQVTNVALEQLHKTLLDAGIEQDILDGVDMTETTKIFSPVFKPNGAKNEVLVWIDGKPKLFMVRDNALYNAIVAQDNQMYNAIMNFPLTKIATASNKVLRFGITASPFFTIRTFVRSVFQMAIKTRATGANYFAQLPMIGKAVSDVVKKNDIYQEWMASGAGQSTMIALEQNYLDKSLDGIALNKKAKNLLKGKYQHESNKSLFNLMTYIGKNAALSPLRGLQTFNDTLDQALKLSEYKVVKKQTKGNIQEAARSSRDADLDYGRFGSPFMRGMNSMTLFWNISFQGIDNIAREFGNHPVRMTARGLLTVTLPTILLYLKNYDDEDYHELNSYEKDMNWMIKLEDGTFAKIPIPFELGILFKSLPEKFVGQLMDAFTGQDKQNWRDFRENISKTLTPSLTPTIWDVSGKYKAEKDTMNDWDFVPAYLKGVALEDQYDENTSEAMKWLGKKLKKSPMVLEGTFMAQFAQAGQLGLYFTDSLLGGAGVVERPDTKGLKRNYLDRYVTASIDDGSTDSVSTFYDKKDALSRKKERTDDEENTLDDYKLANKYLVSLRKVRDGMLYNELLQADGTEFSKEDKKVYIDTVNEGLRDVTRMVQGKKPLNEENMESVRMLLRDYEAFDKKVKKKERKEKAKAKKIRQWERKQNQ